MTSNWKVHKERLYSTFSALMETKRDRYVWGGKELVREWNKLLSHKKIHNTRSLGSILSIISYRWLVFKNFNYRINTQYIFVSKGKRVRKRTTTYF